MYIYNDIDCGNYIICFLIYIMLNMLIDGYNAHVD